MSVSSLSFGKKYISKIPVRNAKTGQKEFLDFVEYNSPQDSYEAKKASEKWSISSQKSGDYAGRIADHIKCKRGPNSKFYGVEDKKGSIQALSELYIDDLSEPSEDDIEATISYVSANPENSYGSNNRKYSKLGTSLFREIIKLAKTFGAKRIDFCDNSNGFWDKMPCIVQKNEYFSEYMLPDENYDACIRKLDEMI